MSEYAENLRRLNLKLQGRAVAIGSYDPILTYASTTIAEAAAHIDHLERINEAAETLWRANSGRIDISGLWALEQALKEADHE